MICDWYVVPATATGVNGLVFCEREHSRRIQLMG